MKLIKTFNIDYIMTSVPYDREAINRLVVRFGSKYGTKFDIPEKELLEVLNEEKELKEFLIDYGFIEDERVLVGGDIIKYNDGYRMITMDELKYGIVRLGGNLNGYLSDNNIFTFPTKGLTLEYIKTLHGYNNTPVFIGNIKEFIDWRKLEAC